MLSSWSRSQSRARHGAARRDDAPAQGFQRFAERRSFDLDRRLPAAFRFRQSGLRPHAGGELLRPRPGRSGRARDDGGGVHRARLRRASGRKVMILLSGGWPFDPVRFAIDSPLRPRRAEHRGGRRPLSAAYRHREPAGVHALHRRPRRQSGHRVRSLAGALLRARFAGDPVVRSRAGAPRRARLPGARDRRQGADQRAGQEPLAATVADTRSYYWLGFTPDRQGDDRSHDDRGVGRRARAAVRSRRRLLRLLARPRAQPGGGERSPLRPPARSPGARGPRGCSATSRAAGKMVLPLTLVVPADAVTFMPKSVKVRGAPRAARRCARRRRRLFGGGGDPGHAQLDR